MRSRLALVSFTPFFGGGEVYCERLSELMQENFEVHAFVANAELHCRLTANGAIAQLLRASNPFERARQARRWLRRFGQNRESCCVVLNGQSEAHLVSTTRRAGLRTVVVRHTDLSLESGPLKRWMYRRNALKADAVVCVSKTLAAQHDFVPRERLFVIPHWATLAPAAERGGSKFTVLYVGRVEREKGICELMQAAEVLNDIDFIIAGDGRLAKKLRQKGLPNVNFVGFQNDLAPLYSEADLLVQPSHSEGSSLVTLEAMAAGLPCLVSDIPALREIACGGAAAALFRSGDSSSLIDQIDAMRRAPERRHQLREAALRQIAKEQLPSQALDRYLRVLRG